MSSLKGLARKEATRPSAWRMARSGAPGHPSGFIHRHDHLAHRDDAVCLEEHVLGAAKADALGAEFPGGARIGRRIGIGAYAGLSNLVSPAHEHGEIAGEFRLDHRHFALQYLTGRTVYRDDVEAPR